MALHAALVAVLSNNSPNIQKEGALVLCGHGKRVTFQMKEDALVLYGHGKRVIFQMHSCCKEYIHPLSKATQDNQEAAVKCSTIEKH